MISLREQRETDRDKEREGTSACHREARRSELEIHRERPRSKNRMTTSSLELGVSSGMEKACTRGIELRDCRGVSHIRFAMCASRNMEGLEGLMAEMPEQAKRSVKLSIASMKS